MKTAFLILCARAYAVLFAALVISSPEAVVAAEAHSVISDPKIEVELLSTFSALKDHLLGKRKMDEKQIEASKLIIDKDRDVCGQNAALIKAALDLVATYDRVMGPLWVARDGFNRVKSGKKWIPPPNDIHWTIYTVMQTIMDKIYTAENVARHDKVLAGFKFGSSAHFSGAVNPPANPNAAYTVKVNGSFPKTFGRQEDGFARRPTGAYLPPGSIVTITVPPSLVGKGYKVRVGAHSWDFSNKPRILRLDRSSLVYDITGAETKVASPLGGGIYIEVPYLADAGVVDVKIKNAVRSPFFSATCYHQTTLAEWKSVERKRQAPWADFQTDKFLMQVPTSWVYKLDDPVALMKNWDLAMDALSDLMGLPRIRGRETMYLQVDLQLRAGVFAPGYPTCNDRYDPKGKYDGYVNHYLIRGPQFAPDYVFHEQGHGFGFVKFGGEMESTVNLLHVAVQNQKFGQSLDEAFAGSRNMQRNKFFTLDNTAVQWMTSLNFLNKKPMEAAEKSYQLAGHAKYVDIVRLFGWQPLNDFWRSWNEDFEAGRPWSKHGTDIDVLSLRLSQMAGVDLTPLLHFWGTPPRDAAALKSAVAAAKLKPSAKVYDTLVHYQSLVPGDNQAFREFAMKWWGKQPSPTGFTSERGHAQQWIEFDGNTSARIKQTVQEIIELYFPGGRPLISNHEAHHE